jgi:biopolymer transport protein ExbB
MKHLLSLVMMGILPLMVLSTPLYGRDMRELQVRAQQTKEALMQKAAEELKAAEQEAAEGRNRIINDKSALKTAIDKVNVQNRQLQQEVEKLTVEHRAMEEKENILSQNLAETDSMVRELVGVIRVNAKDMSALITENLQTALTGNTSDFLEDIAGQSKFPGMEDIRRMADMLFDQIKMSGEVTLTKGIMINRSGSEVEADILALGCFTAAYRLGSEVGFLSYSESGRKLYALSRLPSGRLQKQILRYMEGREEAVPLDVSRGAALRQLTHELSLWQQIPKGGPIVWPILAILGIGIAIVIERVIFLMRRRFDADRVIGRIDTLAAHQDWDACRKACAPFEEKAVVRVVKAGLDCYHLAREEMENALQEAILKEIPPMERYLSTLGMLAAIAPLLGLLGTVTGMIDTFHVITQHGTGDPRMMSGGISVALVTTMLGLSVAIPIMLAHTLLSRAVDNIIGQMEEKAVALVNIVHKNRGA